MIKVSGKNAILNEEEAKLLGEGKEYELIPNQKGIFLLIEKGLVKEKEGAEVKKPISGEEEKQQVIAIIKKSRLSDLVEGKLEAVLDQKQKKALLELVATGKVFVFKLNETYKKGVYRVKEEVAEDKAREKKESENVFAKEKPLEEYTLESDGFLIVKSKDKAAQVSYTYEKQIREGLLRGIKSFDGNYYLLQTDLLDTYINKALLSLSSQHNQTLQELSQNLKVSQLLTRIICEFLKEEGELIEKKKGIYNYIK